ncbi:MAG TPA: arginine deiminase-related protein [Steroidobacteraceae bacterium]|nr:arginine deiminase-related protein [Steroidobacteraceae bacterium]
MNSDELQSTADILMIRPVRFGSNPETLESNRFQTAQSELAAGAQLAAAAEFDGLAAALRAAGVNVHVFEDTPEPHTPDSLFPNNWVSFHADGSVVLYPMLAPNRRAERRNDLLEALSARHGFRIRRVLDLTPHEGAGKFLEGTGSLVLDRVHRIAYACVSPRTDLDVLGDFAQQLDYEVVAFEAVDAGGAPIYHTNVLMCIGTRFAAVCSACIREDERAAVLDALRTTGHTLVDLSMEQLGAFAGNMLELRSARSGHVVAMSSRALDSLSPQQRGLIEQHAGPIVAAPIPTIETLGGGSVRCMLAEIHLQRK